MDIPIRGHSGITIGDAFRGALTGGPDEDLLTNPSVMGGDKLLPSDKACGKHISTIHESFRAQG